MKAIVGQPRRRSTEAAFVRWRRCAEFDENESVATVLLIAALMFVSLIAFAIVISGPDADARPRPSCLPLTDPRCRVADSRGAWAAVRAGHKGTMPNGERPEWLEKCKRYVEPNQIPPQQAPEELFSCLPVLERT